VAFKDWQSVYAAVGIATFPCEITPDGNKEPLVNGPKNIRPTTRLRSPKHLNANLIGFMTGPCNGKTILDVDTTDERVLADAIARHGNTPVVTRSGGKGGFQAWYAWDGEKRDTIRYKAKYGVPIDILGATGIVIAPPSQGTTRQYEFIEGGLEDTLNLPVMRGLEGVPGLLVRDRAPLPKADAAPSQRIPEGIRNTMLWQACMREANQCATLEQLITYAKYWRDHRAAPDPPIDDKEVMKTAASAWGYKRRDENWYGKGGVTSLPCNTIDRLASDPHAGMLLLILRRYHSDKSEFYLANELAHKHGWSLCTFRAAKQRLVDDGEIICIHPGGRGLHDPPIYAWPDKT
jgi:hypothetical protein